MPSGRSSGSTRAIQAATSECRKTAPPCSTVPKEAKAAFSPPTTPSQPAPTPSAADADVETSPKTGDADNAPLIVAMACVLLGAAMFAADFMRTDYYGMGVLTIAVMYLFRKRKVISMLSGCVVLTIMSISEITAFFTLIPVALYNGERGLKMKYFFYIFYPAHLLIIWLIAAAMGMGWISAI